jgi:hypothetical protein
MVTKKLLPDIYCITSYRVSLAELVLYISEGMLPIMLFVYSGYDNDYEPLVPLSFVGMQIEYSDCATSFYFNIMR